MQARQSMQAREAYTKASRVAAAEPDVSHHCETGFAGSKVVAAHAYDVRLGAGVDREWLWMPWLQRYRAQRYTGLKLCAACGRSTSKGCPNRSELTGQRTSESSMTFRVGFLVRACLAWHEVGEISAEGVGEDAVVAHQITLGTA